MAWISTEGNAFNHATDRVPDVDDLAARQKSLGRPMKETVEKSQSGRVRQTAFLAARVQRKFRDANGNLITREVAGSFYEFITRLPMEEDGKTKLDLSFDSLQRPGHLQNDGERQRTHSRRQSVASEAARASPYALLGNPSL